MGYNLPLKVFRQDWNVQGCLQGMGGKETTDIQIMSGWVCRRETQEKGRETRRTLTDKRRSTYRILERRQF